MLADNWGWPHAGALGDPLAQTPVFDRIAREGVVFNHTFCPVPSCSPTRSSLLTGTRPDTTKVWDLVTHFRDALPDVVTLPQHFKNNGYYTVSNGKIFHDRKDTEARSWSECNGR